MPAAFNLANGIALDFGVGFKLIDQNGLQLSDKFCFIRILSQLSPHVAANTVDQISLQRRILAMHEYMLISQRNFVNKFDTWHDTYTIQW